MGVTLPADMMGGHIVSAVCTGVTTHDGARIDASHEYAMSDMHPGMGAALGGGGVSPSVGIPGVETLRIVGGSDMGAPEIAGLNFQSLMGNQAVVEGQLGTGPVAGMAQGMNGPKVRGT